MLQIIKQWLVVSFAICRKLPTLLIMIYYCLNYLTYLLTPWSRVLLEKQINSQLVKKFPAFFGTRLFITTPTLPHMCYMPCPPHSSQFDHVNNID